MNSFLTLEIIESNTSNSNFERGRLLYQKGLVQEFIIINEDFVLAKVKGQKTYKVFLELIDDNYKAYCNCLYKPKGQCKHQVAVKFTLMDVLNNKSTGNGDQASKFFLIKAYNTFVKYVYKLRCRL